MSRMLRIIHRFHYTFGSVLHDPVAMLRLCPLDGGRQRLLHHQVQSSPEPTIQLLGEDEFGNVVSDVMWEPMTELTVTAMSAVELTLSGERLAHIEPEPFVASTDLTASDEEFAVMGRLIFGSQSIDAGSLFRFAKQMRACLRHNDRWDRVRRPARSALIDGEGAHADYAHIAITVLRSAGYPACYVNGYLLPPAGGGRARAHAWIAVFTPCHGWLELDPTLGCPPDLRHLALAVGRDRDDVNPIESYSLTSGLSRTRSSLSCYPLTRTSIPVVAEQELAS